MNPIYWIVTGGVAGWLAGNIMRGRGFGCIGNVIIGLIGGAIGGYVFDALKISMADGFVNAVITSLAGAVILLAISNFLGGNRGR